MEEEVGEQPRLQQLVVWFHDESIFYANDRRKKRWVHKSEKAVLCVKGEGASLMVADFITGGCDPLIQGNQRRETRDGYFTNVEIILQLEPAMDIVQKHYSSNRHMITRLHTQSNHPPPIQIPK